MLYEDCLTAICADPINPPLTVPYQFLFRESTASTGLKQRIYQETGHTSFIKYIQSIESSVLFYGILLKHTNEIIKGPYWSDLLEDEEGIYSIS